MTPLMQLGIFAAKTFIIILFLIVLLILFMMFLGALAKSKQKAKGTLVVNNLNEKYQENADLIYSEILSKKSLKKYLKENKAAKQKEKEKNIYVLNFHGDIRASAVSALSEEVTAILSVATPKDAVFVRLESAGGVVHGYGLAAAQLMRIRAKNIPLIVSIDKVAASGGYLMACIANKIMAAPFAIIGSIGVIVQLPNFHRLLKEKNIDFEQFTAGEFKRTITLFGENTKEGKEKLKEEIEDVHQLFKNLIVEHRHEVDINKVATGEHWLGVQAIDLKLVDDIKTSDDYLLEQSKIANLYEICYQVKKPFLAKLTGASSRLKQALATRHLLS